CGKTTLGRCILRLEEPTEGKIYFESQDILLYDRKKMRHLRQDIQIIFQDPYSSLNPRKSIYSIVTLPLRVHRIGEPGEWRRRVERMMDLVGLPRQMLNCFPDQLSGGQRQRVAIARALISNPRVVICDEPTSALDVSVQSQILNLLQDLQKDFGLTYLFISHNLAVVDHLATNVSVMYLGRIIEEAPTEQLFSNPSHPYTRALLSSVLTPDPTLGLPITSVHAIFPNPLNRPIGCAFHPRCPNVMAV
ncbi:MAG: ABC transporter ATP-binding protein, partial [Deltaproteobacteria bacterium]